MTNSTQNPNAAVYAAVKDVIDNTCNNTFYAIIDSRSVEKALADAMTFAAVNGWKTLRLSFEEGSTEARTLGNIRARIDREDFFNLVDEDGNKVDWPQLSFKPAEANYAAEAAKLGTTPEAVKASYGNPVKAAEKVPAKKPRHNRKARKPTGTTEQQPTATPAAEPVGPLADAIEEVPQGMNLGTTIADAKAREKQMANA